MIVTVIGNGVSRAPIPLDKIKGITIGCNAVYRDFTPDYLCVVDHAITKEIHESNYSGVVYYRHMTLKRLGLNPKTNWHTPAFLNGENTGNAAILLADDLGATQIDLLGFDGVSQKLYPDTAQNKDMFYLWNERLMYLSSKLNLRRVVDETCAVMDIPSITVTKYLQELDESHGNR